MPNSKIIALTALVCILAGVAHAQIIPFGKHTQGLNQTDLNLLIEAAEKLYKSPSPAAGASQTWSNPKTGNVGTVRIVGVERPCVKLRRHIKKKGQTDPTVFVVYRCRAGNKWELRF